MIDPAGGAVVVDAGGRVLQGSVEVGRLRLKNFADNRQLELDQRGYYRAPAGLSEVAYTAEVHQGALEDSNVNGIEAIVALIEVQRSFDGAARALRLISESYRRLNRG